MISKRIKIITILTFSLLLSQVFVTPVQAQGIILGDTVSAEEIINHDAVLFGQTITIDGVINGNVFLLGNQVIINGSVNGSVILLGQNAYIGGSISDGLYTIALTLEIGADASLGRDLYAATVSLVTGQNSSIARHLYAIGLDAGLKGQIGGELNTAIGPIQLYNSLMRLLGFDELVLEFDVTSPQSSLPMRYPSIGHHAKFIIIEPGNSIDDNQSRTFDWVEWSLNLLRQWGVLFFLGLISMWLFKRPLSKIHESLTENPVKSWAVGLIVFIFVLVLFIAALLIAALIFAIGLGLNALELWSFSIGFWVLSYAVLAVLVSILWFFFVYGSKIIVAYWSAKSIFDHLFKKQAFWLDMLALFAGTVVYALLRSIPYVGWVIDVLVTAAGLGAAWAAYRSVRKAAGSVVDPKKSIKGQRRTKATK